MTHRVPAGCTSVLFGLVLAIALSSGTARADTFFDVSATFPSYTLNNAKNPTLTLARGATYAFKVSSTGHPFYIKTQQVTGTASAFNDGVTGNGVENGTLTFTVPQNAPAQLFYICAIHASMTGVINIVPASVPATPSYMALLVLLLAAARVALLAFRRAGS